MILLLLLCAVMLAACSDSQENRSDKNTGDTPAVAKAEPSGLSDSVWIAKGIPDPSDHWNGEEAATAYQILNKEVRSGTGFLPQMNPKGGAQIFSRITSIHHYATENTEELDEQEQLTAGVNLLTPLTQIYMLYLDKAQKEPRYNDELVELMITILAAEEEFMVLVHDFKASVPVEQRKSESFQAGVMQMQQGVTRSISGMIRVLRDKEVFSRAQMERLANALRRDGPELITYLDDTFQDELELEAAKTIYETDSPVIESALRSLFPFVDKVTDSLEAE